MPESKPAPMVPPKSGEVLDLPNPGPEVYPGEVASECAALTTALMTELAPKTAYAKRLARDLVTYEWEIDRHRRLRDAAVIEAYRRHCHRELTVSVLKAASDPIRREMIPAGKEAREEWALQVSFDLISTRPKERRAAETAFVDLTDQSINDLVARAWRSDTARAHDERIRDLERRRRLLRPEYDRLQSTGKPEVADAEIVAAV